MIYGNQYKFLDIEKISISCQILSDFVHIREKTYGWEKVFILFKKGFVRHTKLVSS